MPDIELHRDLVNYRVMELLKPLLIVFVAGLFIFSFSSHSDWHTASRAQNYTADTPLSICDYR